MSGKVKEIWAPRRMTASGKLVSQGASIGGFLCTTGGTLQIVASEDNSGTPADIVSQITVVAATYYPMPFYCASGAYAILGGGAVGTFLV